MESDKNMLLETFEKLMVSSQPESILLVERLVEDLCTFLNIKEEIYGNMLIAVTEAVNNAIHHGNKNNPEKMVTISYDVKPDKIIFHIRDEGNGFDLNRVPDPISENSIPKEGGRGIYIMKKLSDNMEILPPGNQVLLQFNLN